MFMPSTRPTSRRSPSRARFYFRRRQALSHPQIGHQSLNPPPPYVLDGAPGCDEEEGADPEGKRNSRKAIELYSSRNRYKRWFSSRSRTRTRLKLVGQADEPAPVDATDDDSVANVRFSAAKIANDDLADMLRFPIITPRASKQRRQRQAARRTIATFAASSPTGDRQSVHTGACAQSEDTHGAPSVPCVEEQCTAAQRDARGPP